MHHRSNVFLKLAIIKLIIMTTLCSGHADHDSEENTWDGTILNPLYNNQTETTSTDYNLTATSWNIPIKTETTWKETEITWDIPINYNQTVMKYVYMETDV